MPNGHTVVYILGAGVDKSLGMPLANELLSDVAAFANGPGKPMADATKAHLPYLRFSFSKYTGEQGETFAERVLVEDSQALDTTKSVIVFANSRSERLTSQSLEELLSKA